MADAPLTPRLDQPMPSMTDDLAAAFENGTATPRYVRIENLNDGCGCTAGWTGLCTQTGDVLADSGTEDTSAPGTSFTDDWKQSARDAVFQQLQLRVGHDPHQETDAAVGGSPATGADEAQWPARFNTIRRQHTQHPRTPGRENEWPQALDRSRALQQLADQGQWDPAAPLTVGADFNITVTDPHD